MGVLGPRSPRTGRREPVVVEAFHRGLDVFRPLATAYAALLAWDRRDEMVRPWVAVVVLVVMAAWSLGLLAYHRRGRAVLAVEVVIAVAAILATPLADGMDAVQAGQFTLPTVWAAGSVAGAAVVAGARGGLFAAAIVAVADLVEIAGRPTQGTVHNIVIIVLLGGLIGLAVDLARSGLEREEQVLLERERLRERERIARVVHDGVLQSLAFIHRRGVELGGDAGELATLAADQERALRRFVSGAGAPAGSMDLHGVEGAEVDLRLAVTAHERPGVSVAVPGDPLLVDPQVSRELDAALTAVLDNVDRHAGEGARAWVLLEGDPSGVELTVRDDGVGADPLAVQAAASRGRMGVSSSIRGRVEDLGGSATWTTRPGAGCTVRIIVPRTRGNQP
ncbi:MacS family sensor histidine kinase [Phycicoccus avicenniae]|uniref:MacS family sensor histidine kinase n=1 Tax=Phycicoccus avicenniae TaxID=2828860 RepID=UPI003D29C430